MNIDHAVINGTVSSPKNVCVGWAVVPKSLYKESFPLDGMKNIIGLSKIRTEKIIRLSKKT